MGFRICTLISFVFLASSAVSAYLPKIDSTLSETLDRYGQANVVVSMKVGTRDILNELAGLSFSSRTERAQAVYDALTGHARNSQRSVLHFLAEPANLNTYKFGKIRSLWISNQISIQSANRQFVEKLASLNEVSQIQEDEIVQLVQPVEFYDADETSVNAVNQWGVARVQAPEAWEISTGVGIIVAGIDTGVRFTHQILANNYQNDSNSWFDPFDGSEISHDNHGHGTHTVGSAVGINGFGVAPGARWIACKGLNDNGSGSFTSLSTCGQFVICPTNPDGENPDCSKAAHVAINSWGGGRGSNTYHEMIAAWHAAGVIPVFAAGNSGPNCDTTLSPGDGDVIGVGSTTIDDEISTFSSIGPSAFNTMKPEISAPGSTIMSADNRNDNTYRISSGTSMATPHVAGAVALLLSRNPNLSYIQIRALLQSYSDRDLSFSGAICNWISDNVFPNHHFGYGRLNIFKSLEAL